MHSQRILHPNMGAVAIYTTPRNIMSIPCPKIWLPVDFFLSISRSRKRTLHVPLRVVDMWAESRGVKQKSLVLEVRSFLHLTVIIDLQRQT